MTVFLMPCEPGNRRRVDSAWAREHAILREMGQVILLADHDRMEAGDMSGLPTIPQGSLVAWRGWMMSVSSMESLETALKTQDVCLLDNANSYRACHHAPELIGVLSPWSSSANVLPISRLDDLSAFLRGLPPRPVVLKDYVKSEAGLWAEACFIPNPHDEVAARRVINRFLELRGDWLTGGLVLREFVPDLLRDAAGRVAEWRTFVVDGKPVMGFAREDGPSVEPPANVVSEAASQVPARWFAMDWAQRADGTPLLLEVGHGGVSGIPESVDPRPMLEAVASAA